MMEHSPCHSALTRIHSLLDEQRRTLLAHPLFAQIQDLPRHSLVELAFYQYADSILWVPMLSLMKARSTSPRLVQALADNIAHETGLHGNSHIALARTMLRSLGVRDLRALPQDALNKSASLWLSDAFEAFAEPEIAGWLLTAETLVPLFFAGVVDAMERAGCDVAYFREHVHVDGDEHSRWMAESVADVVARADADPEVVDSVARGMNDALAEVLEVPALLVTAAR